MSIWLTDYDYYRKLALGNITKTDAQEMLTTRHGEKTIRGLLRYRLLAAIPPDWAYNEAIQNMAGWDILHCLIVSGEYSKLREKFPALPHTNATDICKNPTFGYFLLNGLHAFVDEKVLKHTEAKVDSENPANRNVWIYRAKLENHYQLDPLARDKEQQDYYKAVRDVEPKTNLAKRLSERLSANRVDLLHPEDLTRYLNEYPESAVMYPSTAQLIPWDKLSYPQRIFALDRAVNNGTLPAIDYPLLGADITQDLKQAAAANDRLPVLDKLFKKDKITRLNPKVLLPYYSDIMEAIHKGALKHVSETQLVCKLFKELAEMKIQAVTASSKPKER